MALLGGSSPSRQGSGCRPGSGVVNAAPLLPRCVGRHVSSALDWALQGVRHPPLSTFARWVLRGVSFSIPITPLSSTLHPVSVLQCVWTASPRRVFAQDRHVLFRSY